MRKTVLQKSNEMELKASWDQYMDANDRWKNIDAQKQAKAEIKVTCFVVVFQYSGHSFIFSGAFELLSYAEWPFEAHQREGR